MTSAGTHDMSRVWPLRPPCPVCPGEQPLNIYMLHAALHPEGDKVNGMFVLCRTCGFTTPVTPSGPSWEDAPAARACSNYRGVCEECRRPPGEHDDL